MFPISPPMFSVLVVSLTGYIVWGVSSTSQALADGMTSANTLRSLSSWVASAKSCLAWLGTHHLPGFVSRKLIPSTATVVATAMVPSSSGGGSGLTLAGLWKMPLPARAQLVVTAFLMSSLINYINAKLQRICLRGLLHYHGWLYENHRFVQEFTFLGMVAWPSLRFWGSKSRNSKQTSNSSSSRCMSGECLTLTKLWYFILKQYFLRYYFPGFKPLLLSFQNSLPRLSVPSLEDTVRRYVDSMRPVVTVKELAKIQYDAADFLTHEGPRLQGYLKLRSYFTTNYVSDWWLKFVYLRARTPLLLGSNYYGHGSAQIPTKVPVARAAALIWEYVRIKQMIDRQTLQPLYINNVIPVCMAQYQHAFSCTRVPGMETDSLVQYEPQDSRHIVVLYQGVWYRVNLVTRDRWYRWLTAWEIQRQLLGIVDPKTKPNVSELQSKVAALTTENRTKWAQVREAHFHIGVNKASLDAIERAMFAVVFEDGDCPEVKKSLNDLTTMSRILLCGNGASRWCDKSNTLVIFPNGAAGIHCEHSGSDAAVMSHIMELAYWHETQLHQQGQLYDSDGYIQQPQKLKFSSSAATASSYLRSKVVPPQQLNWHINEDLALAIEEAHKNALSCIQDLDLLTICHTVVNRQFIKSMGCSPDGFVQMALQLAFYRDQDFRTLAMVYEPVTMRMYCEGRTECVRGCSVVSADWVKSMDDPSVPVEVRAKKLRMAVEDHQIRARDAMCNKGVDRHLFALYVVSRGMGVDSAFLEGAMATPWNLSTSNVPTKQQLELWDGKHSAFRLPSLTESPSNPKQEYYSVSGGFGPLCRDGYGVCYSFAGEFTGIYFHISAKCSSRPKTDTSRFASNLHSAFTDMVAVLRQNNSEGPITP